MSRKQKKYHFIYKTTCKITGKFYVGMHSSDLMDDGYLGSGKILGYSRHKYGDENHTREILEICESREQLRSREKEIVNEELLKDPLNMNLKYGGEGGWDHKPGINIQYQKVDTKARAYAAAATRKRRVLESSEYAESSRLKRSSAAKGRKTFLGKKHSEETKLKMKKSKNVGKQNSQYGKCWIKNGYESFRIDKKQIKEYLDKGYCLGRKIKF